MSGDTKIRDGQINQPDNYASVTNKNLHVQITSTAGNAWGINDEGQGHVVMSGKIDTNNSTSVTLAADASITGVSTEILDYSMINISVYSDVASATDGLSIQQSCDNTNWDITDEYTVPADSGKTYSVQAACRYFRLVYTNGSLPQTVFRLNTLLKKNMTKPSSHRIQDPIIDDDDAELSKSVLTGKDTNGVFRNVNTTEDGDLNISDNSSGLAIAKGDVTGTSFNHKFGNAPDFDTGDNEVTIWDGAEDGTTWELMRYVYSTTADIDSISSSNNADTQDIFIQGLDSNYNLISQTITLQGQTRVALDTDLIRVFRAYNDNSTVLAGHVFIYVNGAITGGVPDTNADIRCIIDPVNQQTEMAVYTVPNGKTGYIRDWYASTSGGSRATNYKIKLYTRGNGKVFRVKHVSALADGGTTSYQHKYEEPEVVTEKTDIEMTAQITETAITGASVSGGFDIVLVDDDPSINQTGLILWLDPSDSSTLTKDTSQLVSVIADKSPQGNDFTQDTNTYKPVYNSTGINNIGCLVYDGAKSLGSTNPVFPTSGNMTCFIVMNFTETALTKDIISEDSADRMFLTSGNSLRLRIDGVTVLTLDADAYKGTDVITGFYNDGTSWTEFIQSDTITNTTANVFDGTQTFLGARDIAGDSGFVGNIGEVIYYNRLLDATERASVTTYLQNKWGIS
jgi:hypothetical protein